MKTLNRIIAQGCIISTVITLCFSVFLKASKVLTHPALALSQYFLILSFSFAIALANLLLSLKALPKIARISIHYVVLLVAFFVIFILSSKIQKPTQSQIFIFFFLFTVLYAVYFGTAVLAKKLLPKLTKSKNQPEGSATKKQTYTSLYH